jgi:hypothetical protein
MAYAETIIRSVFLIPIRFFTCISHFKLVKVDMFHARNN